MAFVPNGDQQLSSDNLSAAVALTIPTDTKLVWIQAEAQDIRMRAGTDPTAAIGIVLRADDPPIELPAAAFATLKFIRVTAGAILNAQYWKL